MPIPDQYAVAFDSYRLAFRELAQLRLLDQFKNKAVLAAVLGAFADESQECYDAILAMMEARTLHQAGGVHLDAIGRIVGQQRELMLNDTAIYFTPDTPRTGVADTLGADLGLAWIDGAPTTGTYPPTDAQYAMQVLGRIKNNMCRFASVPELSAMVWEVFSLKATFTISGPMQIDVTVAAPAPPYALYRLQQWADTSQVQERWYMPYPATIKINSVTAV
jgi:hypothetical protein